jgi:glycosyltransferase involved in cell wall biosynthesis
MSEDERASGLAAKSNADRRAVDVSVVLPFYNPGPLLRPTVLRTLEALEASSLSYEVVAVSDGSSEASVAEISDLASEKVRIVRLGLNQGKGAAVRLGLALSKGRYRGFMDADGDIDPTVLPIYLAHVRAGRADIIYGSKRHPDSDVVYPLLRRWYSFVFQRFVRALFRLHVPDTQTGIKFIRDEALLGILPKACEVGFAFDVELFVVALKLGFDGFTEAPVVIGRRVASTIDVRAIVGIITDTVAVARRLRSGRYGV